MLCVGGGHYGLSYEVSACKRRSGGPIVVSSLGWKWGATLTPWCACTTAGQRHGCCSRTHCHTCNTTTDWVSFTNTNTVGISSSAPPIIMASKPTIQCLETHQEMSLTKLSLREMPAPASKMEEWVSPTKSEDTTYNAQTYTHKHTHRIRNTLALHKVLGKTSLISSKTSSETYGVLCVSQNSLHGSVCGLLHRLFDVSVAGGP